MVWEKKPTPEEEEKAKSLQLPPTFFCELGTSDSEGEAEEFETEVCKIHEALVCMEFKYEIMDAISVVILFQKDFKAEVNPLFQQ